MRKKLLPICFAGIYLLQLMADIEPPMVGGFLRSVDADDILICEAYRLAHSTAETIRDVKTPCADKFASSIKIDTKGNFTASFSFTDEALEDNPTHTIILNKKQTKHC